MRAALAVRPESSGALYYLAHRLENAGRFEESLLVFKRVSQLQPEDVLARLSYANLLLKLDRFDQAIEACRAAIAIEPDNPNAHTNLGNALAGEGQIDDAIAEYKRPLNSSQRVQALTATGATSLMMRKRTMRPLPSFSARRSS